MLNPRTDGRLRHCWAALALAAMFGALAATAFADTASEDARIANEMAEMLRDARAIVSNNQSRINDPQLGDKGLSGKVVVAQAVATFKKNTGVDPTKIDPATREGRLLRAMMASIEAVMEANQATINQKGVGFKAFIPAVFGRLVGEEFAREAKGEATIKVTAPRPLVRNRKALPDAWEENVIKTKLLSPNWRKGETYAANAEANGRPAYRIMVPEYYSASCLTCHGSPKGEMDVTGYPKEGGKLGDLGGVMSIALFH